MKTLQALSKEIEDKQALLSEIILPENRDKMKREILELCIEYNDRKIIEKMGGEQNDQ